MRKTFVACLPLLCLLTGCRAVPEVAGTTHTPVATTQSVANAPSTATPSSTERNELFAEGLHLFEKTYERLPTVKARLHCSSCHLQGGTTAGAAPLIGVAAAYPQFSTRAGRQIDLGDRVNECLELSMNGQKLAPESSEMKAFLAYIEGLRSPREASPSVPPRGIPPLAAAPQAADATRGKALYDKSCLPCHQADGSGTYDGQEYRYPALWGDRSFTVGSEMALPSKLASFLFIKMPLGQGKTLTVQDAWDIATYVSRQPRPDQPDKAGEEAQRRSSR